MKGTETLDDVEIRSFAIKNSRVHVHAPGLHGDPTGDWRIHYNTDEHMWPVRIARATTFEAALKAARDLARIYAAVDEKVLRAAGQWVEPAWKSTPVGDRVDIANRPLPTTMNGFPCECRRDLQGDSVCDESGWLRCNARLFALREWQRIQTNWGMVDGAATK